jgi:hypothetical protein
VIGIFLRGLSRYATDRGDFVPVVPFDLRRSQTAWKAARHPVLVRLNPIFALTVPILPSQRQTATAFVGFQKQGLVEIQKSRCEKIC